MGVGISEGHRQALRPGSIVGRYRLETQLGFGSFGITYLAHDTGLNRRVAIKELLPTAMVTRMENGRVVAVSQDDEAPWAWAQRRFMDEARALAACQHPHILHIYEIFPENGTVYMVSRYEEGCALREWLRRLNRPMNEGEIRGLLEPLLSALALVHGQGFLHRDIKPDNIYLAGGQRPLLIDFGSARQEVTNRSAPVTAIVTEGYAPFEQYSEKGAQGPWTDLYALGAVLYTGITGRKPPSATARLSMENDPCQPLAQTHARSYSQALLVSIDTALRMRPEQRLQSAAQWRAMLGGGGGMSQSVPQPAPIPNHQPSYQQPYGQPPAPAERRSPAVVIALAVAGVAALLTIAALWAGHLSETEERTGGTGTLSSFQGSGGGGGGGGGSGVGYGRERAAARDPLSEASIARPFVNSLGMEFVPIPGTGILMCVHETRRRDYAAYARATPLVDSTWDKPEVIAGVEIDHSGNNPVANVSWEDATGSEGRGRGGFCGWLSREEGRRYRLPTDHEWSMAVGVGQLEDATNSPKTKDAKVPGYPWGGTYPPSSPVANYGDETTKTLFPGWTVIAGYRDGFGTVAPVKSFAPNRLGIYDLGGNVWETCEDWYDESDHKYRVVRGGSWGMHDPKMMLSSYRGGNSPGLRGSHFGFRVVVELPGR